MGHTSGLLVEENPRQEGAVSWEWNPRRKMKMYGGAYLRNCLTAYMVVYTGNRFQTGKTGLTQVLYSHIMGLVFLIVDYISVTGSSPSNPPFLGFGVHGNGISTAFVGSSSYTG